MCDNTLLHDDKGTMSSCCNTAVAVAGICLPMTDVVVVNDPFDNTDEIKFGAYTFKKSNNDKAPAPAAADDDVVVSLIRDFFLLMLLLDTVVVVVVVVVMLKKSAGPVC
jgi:hypothetical protein